jgi:hypothetical protein
LVYVLMFLILPPLVVHLLVLGEASYYRSDYILY